MAESAGRDRRGGSRGNDGNRGQRRGGPEMQSERVRTCRGASPGKSSSTWRRKTPTRTCCCRPNSPAPIWALRTLPSPPSSPTVPCVGRSSTMRSSKSPRPEPSTRSIPNPWPQCGSAPTSCCRCGCPTMLHCPKPWPWSNDRRRRPPDSSMPCSAASRKPNPPSGSTASPPRPTRPPDSRSNTPIPNGSSVH